jgi:membrane fusion protein, copper/silver efflux system
MKPHAYRSLVLGIAIGTATSVVLVSALLWLRANRHDAPDTDAHADHARPAADPDEHAGHDMPAAPPPAGHADPHAVHGPAAPAGHQEITLSPQRLQAIGVRFAPVERRVLDRQVRTTGQVEVDERRLARVTLNVQGWVDELFVSTTGERVRQGDPLLTLYSPDLVVTQEEHLLALASARTLRQSDVDDVARRADTLIEATRRRLRLWDISETQIEELERTGEARRTMTIAAPAGGTVLERSVLQGMQVMPGQDLYTIADLSRVWVVADVYEHELPFVRVGQQADITLAYEPGARRSGRLSFVYPTVDPQTRTARVRFEVPNPGERLKPGMFVQVDLSMPVGTRLAVPRDALMDTGVRQLAFLHLGGGRIGWREVRTGVRVGEWIEILEGLEEGEHIVTSPAFLIDSESRLGAAVAGLHAGH